MATATGRRRAAGQVWWLGRCDYFLWMFFGSCTAWLSE